MGRRPRPRLRSRSELAGLDRDDLEFTDDGMVITLRRSKTDQESSGRKVGLPWGADEFLCSVRAMQNWLSVSVLRRDHSCEGSIATPISPLMVCRTIHSRASFSAQRAWLVIELTIWARTA